MCDSSKRRHRNDPIGLEFELQFDDFLPAGSELSLVGFDLGVEPNNFFCVGHCGEKKIRSMDDDGGCSSKG
jgi:hypothetical protein